VNVVDSSAWLEYFADGPNAGEFAEIIADIERLVVPGITLFEVFKRVRVQRDPAAALYAVAQMMRGRVVDLDAELAVAAAALSAETGLALADSVVLATARDADATLWTQDSDFEGMDGVELRRGGGSGSAD
jgi:predicted nucleic acid-binding protein